MDVVLHSIPVRISEAVLHMQENTELYTLKVSNSNSHIYGLLKYNLMSCIQFEYRCVFVCQVFQACGGRGEEGTQSSVSDEPKKKGKSVTALEYKASSTAAVRLEVQVCVCLVEHCYSCTCQYPDTRVCLCVFVCRSLMYQVN